MPTKVCLLAAAALVLTVTGAGAQDSSDYRAIFERQMETFELGPTRGVKIVPLEQPDTGAVAVEQGTGGTGPGTAPASGLDLTAGAATHAVLPVADQLNMRITFAFDSAAIAETEEPKLRQICEAVDAAQVGHFRIVGHTDATGDAAYNQRLSERRAEEVVRFFTADCGIAAERLEAIGVGKQFPANAADPFAGENRRVEFQAMS
jgi:OmpA-OmpF porin, OOP family